MSGVGTAWAIGGSHGRKKRIHRGDCKHAKHPYNWAGNRTERELFDALVESGAATWHDAGKCCSEYLDWALWYATRKQRDEATIAYYRSKLSIEPPVVVQVMSS